MSFRAGNGSGVNAGLVGASEQQTTDIRNGAPDAAADGERQEDHVSRRAGDHVKDGVAIVGAGGDVEECKFIGARGIVNGGLLDRVAGIAQAT